MMLATGGEVGGTAAAVHQLHGGGHLGHVRLHSSEGNWAADTGTVHPAAVW